MSQINHMDWETRSYAGATKVSRELITHWQEEYRTQKLFFAQLETAKMAIFLTEATPGLLHGIKTSAALRWVDAVNRDGRLGQWAHHPVTSPPEPGALLEKVLATAH